MYSYEYLLSDINTITGIGTKTANLLRKKNINTVFDLLWSLPRDYVDRRNLVKINELQIGKVQTIIVDINKYNFPRVRNLPNKVICKDDTGELDCIFFNSYEGYIKKILPINSRVTVSGKIGYYKKKYQIINLPTYGYLMIYRKYFSYVPFITIKKNTIQLTGFIFTYNFIWEISYSWKVIFFYQDL